MAIGLYERLIHETVNDLEDRLREMRQQDKLEENVRSAGLREEVTIYIIFTFQQRALLWCRTIELPGQFVDSRQKNKRQDVTERHVTKRVSLVAQHAHLPFLGFESKLVSS